MNALLGNTSCCRTMFEASYHVFVLRLFHYLICFRHWIKTNRQIFRQCSWYLWHETRSALIDASLNTEISPNHTSIRLFFTRILQLFLTLQQLVIEGFHQSTPGNASNTEQCCNLLWNDCCLFVCKISGTLVNLESATTVSSENKNHELQ